MNVHSQVPSAMASTYAETSYQTGSTSQPRSSPVSGVALNPSTQFIEEVPLVRQRLAERIPPRIHRYILEHAAVRRDKKDTGASRTQIETDRGMYLLQHCSTKKWDEEKDRSVLGKGNTANVRNALSSKDDDLAAKKYKLADPAEAAEVAENEYRMLTHLKGETRFPRVYDIAHTIKNDRPASVVFMERLEGETVAAYLDGLRVGIRNNDINFEEVQQEIEDMLCQCFDAVETAWKNGVGIADMHIGNAMRGSDGFIKLFDLAAAKDLSKNPDAKQSGRVGLNKIISQFISVFQEYGTYFEAMHEIGLLTRLSTDLVFGGEPANLMKTHDYFNR